MNATAPTDTREALMTTARTMVQRDGYNALSFRDLAAEIGVKSSSVHYHFPTKGDLAEALLGRYCDDMATFLESLDGKTFEQALDAYTGVFRSGLDGTNRMCIGGMLSAEVNALPPPVRVQIERFGEINTEWLRKIVSAKHKRISADKAAARATAIYAAIEGAQLIARGRGGDPAVFDGIIDAYKASGLLD
jgi:TetR/AcrR family transcriptional repressor of nem operon